MNHTTKRTTKQATMNVLVVVVLLCAALTQASPWSSTKDVSMAFLMNRQISSSTPAPAVFEVNNPRTFSLLPCAHCSHLDRHP